MLRKNRILKNLTFTIGASASLTLIGCGGAPEGDATTETEAVVARESALGVEVVTCSNPASTGYDPDTKNLDLTMSTENVVMSVMNGYLAVNGFPCVTTTAEGGGDLKPSDVKQITITGTAADEKLVIDSLGGKFGSTILSKTGGIIVNMSTGTDQVSIRGSETADRYSAGDSGGATYFEISGDKNADIMISGAETIAVALSDGNDTFDASGGAYTATHLLGSELTTLTAVVAGLTINGGAGNDTLTGGAGSDTIGGGDGDDTFLAAAAIDGDDTFAGGAGTDKVDYSRRENSVTVVLDGVTASGEATETDTIETDVENAVGGAGDDDLTGNDVSNRLQGGPGNDVLSGGPANGDCSLDVDSLEGDDGDDTFDQGTATDCGDVMIGGKGNDTVDYQLRTGDLTIDLDGTADDGEDMEADNVRNDVEVVICGAGDDTVVGSSGDNELHGGAGADNLDGGNGNDTLIGGPDADTLSGGAGIDFIDESLGDDPAYTASVAKGTGGDIINGGRDADKLTYASRAGVVTVTMCVDASALTGATSSMDAECVDDDGESGEADKVINIEHLIGGDAADVLTGGSANETIEGGPAADVIVGGAGNDILYGDAGADDLDGGDGDDYLDGGADADTMAGGAGDGDLCLAETGETPTTCEL